MDTLHAGKYLTFFLGEQEFGFEILKVQELIGVIVITAVDEKPPYFKGTINLRGEEIPVIDLRLKFGMEEIEITPNTTIIVVDVDSTIVGVIVDQVSMVQDITAVEVTEAPSTGTSVDQRFILGVARENIVLLDIKEILSEDLLHLKALS